MNYVEKFWELPKSFKQDLKTAKSPFNGFSEFIYYRTYSRNIDGRQERWADTVIRVIEGIMSIRYDYYRRNRTHWNESCWLSFAKKMALSMYNMEWLPSGRGLWAMGTPLIYERGGMALYNCAYTEIGNNWIEDLCWMMDSLMYGVGVGFQPVRGTLMLLPPQGTFRYVIPDSREGWVQSIRELLQAFEQGSQLPIFDYSLVRPEGSLITTFGGTASGPEPLRDLHNTITDICYAYLQGDYDIVRFKTDLANLIGVCVVTGNTRRSAQIAIAPVSDPVFMDLKDYEKYPDRERWGWMSNNSVILDCDDDFNYLSEIAYRNHQRHDIGYVNMRNLPYSRLCKHDPYVEDKATGINPCGEIPLENRETCNVVETFPTRCFDQYAWFQACEFATFYASTVALLPTHQTSTNAVLFRNRRIGVSLADYVGWKYQNGTNKVINWLRDGYLIVQRYNEALAREAGIPESIRITTCKPGGTVPKLAQRRSGIGHSNFNYMIRRVRVQANTHIEQILKNAGVPYEPDIDSKMTTVFEFPLYTGPESTHPSLWEQAMDVVLMQREWADNSVSNTLYFTNEEEHELESVLAAIAPLTKSVSMSRRADGLYPQMPEEGITRDEYERRVNAIKEIDWRGYSVDSTCEKYCDGESCSLN